MWPVRQRQSGRVDASLWLMSADRSAPRQIYPNMGHQLLSCCKRELLCPTMQSALYKKCYLCSLKARHVFVFLFRWTLILTLLRAYCLLWKCLQYPQNVYFLPQYAATFLQAFSGCNAIFGHKTENTNEKQCPSLREMELTYDRKCFIGNKTKISKEIINKQLVSVPVRPSTSDVYFLEGSEYFVSFSSSALTR